MLRLVRFPYLSVPVISNLSFADIAASTLEPELSPFETEERLFSPCSAETQKLSDAELGWVAANWIPAGQLLNSNPKFYSAFKAFDAAPVRGRASASMLALWGGLEQLFAPSAGELRFRVAALLSSYLENPGNSRMDRYKEVLKLYNERSMAAHSVREVEAGPLVQTYVLMRNALMKMIQERRVPAQADLEALLFGATDRVNE